MILVLQAQKMSNCPDLFIVSIFWFVLILKLQFHTSTSKIIEECEIASKLFDANIDDNLAHIRKFWMVLHQNIIIFKSKTFIYLLGSTQTTILLFYKSYLYC